MSTADVTSAAPLRQEAIACMPCLWTEAELLQQLLQRRSAAWRELHRRYDRLITSTILRVTERFTLSRADREEIRGIFLCGLLAGDMHRLRAFESDRGTRLGTWLCLLARNAAWDFVRRSTRMPRAAPHAASDDVAAVGADPLELLLAKETCHEVLGAIGALSPRDRTFVDMIFFEDRPVEQVAVHLQISVHTVYSRKNKLRERLRASLER